MAGRMNIQGTNDLILRRLRFGADELVTGLSATT